MRRCAGAPRWPGGQAALKRVDAFVTAAALTIADKADPSQPDRHVQHAEHHHAVQRQRRAGAGDPVRLQQQPRRGHAAVALQIAAGPMQEQPRVLRIAHAYQQATDWHRRHPSLDLARAA